MKKGLQFENLGLLKSTKKEDFGKILFLARGIIRLCKNRQPAKPSRISAKAIASFYLALEIERKFERLCGMCCPSVCPNLHTNIFSVASGLTKAWPCVVGPRPSHCPLALSI